MFSLFFVNTNSKMKRDLRRIRVVPISRCTRVGRHIQQRPRQYGPLDRHRVSRSAGFSFACPQKPWDEGWSWRWPLRSSQLFLSAWRSEDRRHCTRCELHPGPCAIRASRLCYSCDICLGEQRARSWISRCSTEFDKNKCLHLCVSWPRHRQIRQLLTLRSDEQNRA